MTFQNFCEKYMFVSPIITELSILSLNFFLFIYIYITNSYSNLNCMICCFARFESYVTRIPLIYIMLHLTTPTRTIISSSSTLPLFRPPALSCSYHRNQYHCHPNSPFSRMNFSLLPFQLTLFAFILSIS